MRIGAPLCAAVLALLCACTFISTPGPTTTLPSPTLPLVTPTPPAGWQIHNGPSFQLSMPSSWEQVSLDEVTLKNEINGAASNNPHLADTLRSILDTGRYKSFLFYGIDNSASEITRNVSVIRTPRPDGSSIEQTERDYAEALPSVLKGSRLVAIETALEINGHKAGEVDYDLPIVNAAGAVVTLRGVQYLFFTNTTDTYVVTVTGDASDQEAFVPLARQVGRSFFVTIR